MVATTHSPATDTTHSPAFRPTERLSLGGTAVALPTNSMRLNGTSAYWSLNQHGFSTANSFVMSFWIYSRTPASGLDTIWQCISNDENESITAAFPFNNGDDIMTTLRNGASTSRTTTGNMVPQNTWVHVCFVFTGGGTGRLRTYVNGVSQTNFARSGDYTDAAQNAYFGNGWDAAEGEFRSNWLDADIFDWQLYLGTANTGIASAAYNSGVASLDAVHSTEVPTVRLFDGETDYSGNANDMTLVNVTTVESTPPTS